MAKRPKKLLIVDDEEDLLFIMALGARQEKRFVVETALDGEQGLAKALTFRPDVAVLDGIMPKMNGYELCRRLRSTPRTRGLPIVILSGDEPIRGESLARLAGADLYVRKPYDQDALLDLLAALSRSGGKRQSGGASGIRTRE